MSLYLKDIISETEPATDTKLKDITDEELNELIEELGAEYLRLIDEDEKNINLDPELVRILEIEDDDEGRKQYIEYAEKHGGITI